MIRALRHGCTLDQTGRNNSEYLEGRVEGQEIVILTKFVKRQARD
jgi:hypothetical protein